MTVDVAVWVFCSDPGSDTPRHQEPPRGTGEGERHDSATLSAAMTQAQLGHELFVWQIPAYAEEHEIVTALREHLGARIPAGVGIVDIIVDGGSILVMMCGSIPVTARIDFDRSTGIIKRVATRGGEDGMYFVLGDGPDYGTGDGENQW